TSERAQRFVDSLAAICRDCKVPASLAEVGVREADLTRLAEDAMKQTRLLVNNPREVTFQDAYAIYSEALDGKRRQVA
ncbi:MAG: iron-containing alcohol dehydrogenase, partial [Microvirga sp.]